MIPGQLSFEDPPAQAHSRTSRAAATAIKERAPSLRQRVYDLIQRAGPITDQGISVTLGLAENTCRPRRIELVKAGLVRAAPAEQLTTSGRHATAWEASEPAHAVSSISSHSGPKSDG